MLQLPRCNADCAATAHAECVACDTDAKAPPLRAFAVMAHFALKEDGVPNVHFVLPVSSPCDQNLKSKPHVRVTEPMQEPSRLLHYDALARNITWR